MGALPSGTASKCARVSHTLFGVASAVTESTGNRREVDRLCWPRASYHPMIDPVLAGYLIRSLRDATTTHRGRLITARRGRVSWGGIHGSVPSCQPRMS